jgi:hypothetical protein
MAVSAFIKKPNIPDVQVLISIEFSKNEVMRLHSA